MNWYESVFSVHQLYAVSNKQLFSYFLRQPLHNITHYRRRILANCLIYLSALSHKMLESKLFFDDLLTKFLHLVVQISQFALVVAVDIAPIVLLKSSKVLLSDSLQLDSVSIVKFLG